MYTQKLLIHNCGQRKCAEGIHASFVYALGVFVLAFELEGEVVCQMPALVVSS